MSAIVVVIVLVVCCRYEVFLDVIRMKFVPLVVSVVMQRKKVVRSIMREVVMR